MVRNKASESPRPFGMNPMEIMPVSFHWITTIPSRLVLAFFAFFMPVSLVTGSAMAQGQLKSVHGDWQMRCEKQAPPGSPPQAQATPAREQCAIVQSVAAEDRPNTTLTVIILRTQDSSSRLLRVVAPLNVLLPAGLGLKIDEADIGRAGFVRCLQTGCVAEVVMDEKLVGQMKTGQNATFIIFYNHDEGIGIPVSLNGFAKAFDSLP
jgi:invasion protein IalB